VSEGFLTRWSRLKRETEEATPVAAPEPGTPNEPAAPAGTEDTTAAQAPETDAPAVDLAALPPIESINAGTDVRAFLAAGVPAQLARAALRRAWSADPSIRDFVGLAENAWDFNAADAMPGFGPLTPSQPAQQLIADAMGEENPRPPLSRSDGEPLQKPDVSVGREAGPHAAVEEGAPVAEQDNFDAAMQNEKAVDERPKRSARRHGGALPE
jgi:hypothetical protein